MKIRLTPLKGIGILMFFGVVYCVSMSKVHSFYNYPKIFTLLDLFVMGLICLGLGLTMSINKKQNKIESI